VHAARSFWGLAERDAWTHVVHINNGNTNDDDDYDDIYCVGS
jgi:hypothetical protein